MSNKPTGFKDLPVEELRRSAIEDFAVKVEPKDNKAVVTAALIESGVKWEDYVAQHPEVAPEKVAPVVPEPTVTVVETAVEVNPNQRFIQNPDGTFSPVDDEPVAVVPEPRVRTFEQPTFNPNDKLLVKMHDRENPLYEVRGYRFTQEHPYALMTPEDATYLIGTETGFRQALPTEASEFYG